MESLSNRVLKLTLVVVELVWRIVPAVQYRPIPDCETTQLPHCTVIVPAFNEDVQVYQTLKSLAASDIKIKTPIWCAF